MQHSSSDPRRLALGCSVLAGLLMLAACAGNSGTSTMPAEQSPQDRSPLAAPPASMMTPHGY